MLRAPKHFEQDGIFADHNRVLPHSVFHGQTPDEMPLSILLRRFPKIKRKTTRKLPQQHALKRVQLEWLA
jgi:hypothetical protein